MTVLFLRSLFFTIVVPGTVAVLVPYLILPTGYAAAAGRWTLLRYLALVPIVAGSAILLWCIRDFAVAGRGTLAPVDPPKELVVRGMYRYVRNPMYVGVLLMLLGQAALFRSVALVGYAAVFFVFVNLFVMLYEEPTLRRRFGSSYERYCRSVGRWVPRSRSSRGAA